ncbi:MAG: hypothetical protein K6F53_13085 [Lachnospiraceae bacterium]|nr:hypothetical protein [Lachnospiraceae bacterium]
MSFSLGSLLFVGLVFAGFYLLRRRARAYFLLLSSIVFIGFLDIRSCIWVIIVTAAVYLFGLAEGFYLDRGYDKTAHTVAWTGIICCAGSLLVLKTAAGWNLPDGIFSGLILPIGFSYYVFQAIAYLADILKGKLRAEKNILFLALYMCYFPKFISGPIEAPEVFLARVKSLDKVYLKDDNKLSIAFPTILYGLFMKVVVADRLAIYTSRLLASPDEYGSLWLFAGMLMYTIQIYCDFAGYSSIAVGISNLFGITLTENFFAPYFADNMSVFWQRWHASLSGWLKNYIYIPLGGSRKGTFRRYMNLMAVFLICGLWHGMGLNFLVWGALHGIFAVCSVAISGKRSFDRKKGRNAIARPTCVITFFCAAFGWIFFGAENLTTALKYVGNMIFLNAGEGSLLTQAGLLGFSKADIVLPAAVAAVVMFDLLMLKKGMPVGRALCTLPAWARYTIEYLLIMAVLIPGIYGPAYDQANFMYMRF